MKQEAVYVQEPEKFQLAAEEPAATINQVMQPSSLPPPQPEPSSLTPQVVAPLQNEVAPQQIPQITLADQQSIAQAPPARPSKTFAETLQADTAEMAMLIDQKTASY